MGNDTEMERVDPDGPQLDPMGQRRLSRGEIRRKLRLAHEIVVRDKMLIRAIQFTCVLLVVGLGLTACAPAPQPPPPPLPPPPPPVAMTVPFPPVAEPVYMSPPPVRHRAKVRTYRATTMNVARCPAGMYWSTSRRVMIVGTTKTKTVSGSCVPKKKGRLSDLGGLSP